MNNFLYFFVDYMYSIYFLQAMNFHINMYIDIHVWHVYYNVYVILVWKFRLDVKVTIHNESLANWCSIVDFYAFIGNFKVQNCAEYAQKIKRKSI